MVLYVFEIELRWQILPRANGHSSSKWLYNILKGYFFQVLILTGYLISSDLKYSTNIWSMYVREFKSITLMPPGASLCYNS